MNSYFEELRQSLSNIRSDSQQQNVKSLCKVIETLINEIEQLHHVCNEHEYEISELKREALNRYSL